MSGSGMNDISIDISRKLLEGWKLLAEHCPQCYSPLVQSDDDNTKIYCVKCAMYCKKERDINKNKNNNINNNYDNNNNNINNNYDNNNYDNNNNNNKSFKEMEVDSNIPTGVSDIDIFAKYNVEKEEPEANVSKKLGDKLLEGWTLMAEICESCQCPLMRNRSKQYHCVSCGNNFIEDGSKGLVPLNNSKQEKLPTKTSSNNVKTLNNKIAVDKNKKNIQIIDNKQVLNKIDDFKHNNKKGGEINVNHEFEKLCNNHLKLKIVSLTKQIENSNDFEECNKCCNLIEKLIHLMQEIDAL